MIGGETEISRRPQALGTGGRITTKINVDEFDLPGSEEISKGVSAMNTAEKIYKDIITLPMAERERLFSLIARAPCAANEVNSRQRATRQPFSSDCAVRGGGLLD
ncbi:MAG: hypothetical protein KKI04_04415 [Proteobacteria bacterium]|nr:hypothetical protein [Pseudomonadota bacterium]